MTGRATLVKGGRGGTSDPMLKSKYSVVVSDRGDGPRPGAPLIPVPDCDAKAMTSRTSNDGTAGRRDGGTAGRRDGGTAGRRDGGTAGRRDGGTA